MELSYRPRTKLVPRAKLMGRMKLGNFFSLSEKQFSQFIEKIEKDELFQEILRKYRIVRYRKFPAVKPVPPSLELKEELTPGDSFDFTELVQKDPDSWEVVKKVALQIGEEKFSLFLEGKNSLSFDDISRECDLSPEETQKFKDFINSFQLQESFFTVETDGSSPPAYLPRKERVAYIENREGKLYILPLDDSTYLVRGRYIIDYQRWEILVKEREIPPWKVKKISSLFRKLDMINQRTTTLYQILTHIKERQRPYFLSGNPRQLVPLTQKEVAGTLQVNPSTVSRTIARKSIICPWGEEKELKEFFPGEKEKIKALLVRIISQEKEKIKRGIQDLPLNDAEIARELRLKFGIRIARRTVAKYRKELKIPSSLERKKFYKME